MSEHQILYAIRNEKCIVKMVGEIRYTLGNSFNKILEKAFNNSAVESYILDLKETSYIDSTNLGLIAKIANWCQKKNFKKPVIISNNEDVNVVLFNMGFDHFFYIVDEASLKENGLKEVEFTKGKGKEVADLILEAHKTLMEMNEKNREEFKSVVDVMEQQVNQ
ncbi:MAG: STAS domain-containing protein [Nitrospinae bacterium]|nr:STAS domain-containing protein [Nitrospinota bacterium]